MSVPTVRVCSEKRPEGWVSINESDFNPSTHFLWSDDLEGSPDAAEPKKKASRR